MRIGVNTLFLIPGEVGGSEVFTRALLDAVRQHRSAPELVLFTNEENHDTFAGYERVPTNVDASERIMRILAEQFVLPRFVREQRVDILLSPGYTGPARCGCPRVVVTHDTQFLAHPEDFSFFERLAHRIFVGGSAWAADHILTPTEFSKREIETRLKIDSNLVTVIGEAPDPTYFDPQPCDRRTPFLLYVANTYPHKNAQRLVSAFATIADRIPHDLVIVGKARGGEPSSHPRVVRLSGLSDRELCGLYHACALYVSPSLYEGFGLPVTEAMAAGARLVLADAATHRELAEDCATYFDPRDEHGIANAILDALAEPESVRDSLRAMAIARAQQFSWEATAGRVMGALQQALAEHR